MKSTNAASDRVDSARHREAFRCPRREEAPRAEEASANARPASGGSALLRRFEQPSTARATWQVANSVAPYLATLGLMVLTIRDGLPWWTTLALAVPASGFMVRIFILMHDCAHSSFLRSRRAERVLGRILGVLVFTPFAEWRHSHLGHHAPATSGSITCITCARGSPTTTCSDASTPPRSRVPSLTLSRSIGRARLALWDERANAFVSFRAARQTRCWE